VQRHRRSRLSNSHHERSRSSKQKLLHPKKVGSLPVSDQEVKRTNEIKTAIPLLDAIDIQGKDVTADALLTQRKPVFFKTLPYILMTAKNQILSNANRLITAESKSAKSGLQPNSTTI
jgi:hypothetical protein